MADLTDYFEAEILKWAFQTASATRPTAWHVGLFTTMPTDDTGLTSAVEMVGSGYARQSATFALSAQTLTLTSALTYGPAGSASWPTALGFGVWDAASGSVILAFETLTSSRSIGSGDSAEFATSALTITID
jgi:hypothetical protein